ncbi:phosphoribosyltransferase family protein [Nocardia sp. 004]|uniref:phosphoribosyltransferase family protein n=1 Tax=Nocardia sp. 004 TaxID=3385978 RepID=UPI0039A1ACB8
MLFDDRRDAGCQLAQRLDHLRSEDVLVVGLPRGGVPVAYEIAQALDAPLDVIVVRKLGVPYQPELAFGAIGEDGVLVINDIVVARAGLTSADMTTVERRERGELSRRAERLRRTHSRIPLSGRTVVIVDDGIATGATARAACQVAWAQGARRVVLAVPVAPDDALAVLKDEADEVVCLEVPSWFGAVGCWYRRFDQVSDAEVTELLRRAAGTRPEPQAGRAGDLPLCDEEVLIQAGTVGLAGHFTIPDNPIGIVLFAHGSGSSRHSPRNRYVAEVLNRSGLGTLLFDLLTPDEEIDRARVFDIELLSRRLVAATGWLTERTEVAGMRIGYFGASTGAAAALLAAAHLGTEIAAVVSRGGRVDLAGPTLTAVRAPTLLIVGSRDHIVLELNQLAAQEISGDTRLTVVPGATHLFAETGALEKVAELAGDWFMHKLAPAAALDIESGRVTGTRS